MDELKAELAELGARMDNAEDRADRHEIRLNKLDDITADLREAVAKVATKDDLLELRKDIGAKFDKQLSAALSSIPGWIGVLLTGGLLLIGAAELFMHSHG